MAVTDLQAHNDTRGKKRTKAGPKASQLAALRERRDLAIYEKGDRDAAQIGALWRKACQGLIESTKAAIECGQRLRDKKDSLPHGSWLPWLEANKEVLGFDTPRTPQMLMKAAANTKLASHLEIDDLATAAAINRQMWGHTNVGGTADDEDALAPADQPAERQRDDLDLEGLLRDSDGNLTPQAQKFIREVNASAEAEDEPSEGEREDDSRPYRTIGSGKVGWHTPARYVEAARAVLGSIDLDPATNAIAQRTVRAAHYFTVDDDGLSKPWHGRVFCNPPFERSLIGPFVAKLVSEYEAGNVAEAILLTHNFCDTAWAHQALGAATAFCLTRGRINFIDADDNIASPTNGQVLFYFGNQPDRFAAIFSEIGFVAIGWDSRLAGDR